ncbi:HsdM family class I SAM-dependent methyltransferase [Mycoplasmopsis primatum]|uniref:HsdM family class I SAM-dependent methyltransferase n=1 Tax=Mycoplasmopsis primatum TaxID=55604 RepID=UPI0004969852|nr:N-6 DNA methylase [Mycoplasmopsis primatum]
MNKIDSREKIIKIIGEEYLTSNIENGEFSYKKLKIDINNVVEKIKEKFGKYNSHWFVDIRFVDENSNVTVLFETKKNHLGMTNDDAEQIYNYYLLEKEFSDNDVISIFYNFRDQTIKIWKNEELLDNEKQLNNMQYYIDLFREKRKNDKNKVLDTTNKLNEKLHKNNIDENQRSQFVGCLLVALNNGLNINNDWTSTAEILDKIKFILKDKINKNSDDLQQETKINLLINILENQNIRDLHLGEFKQLLLTIYKDLIPYINDKTAQGEDLLNLFFTTFNKYVGKKDKNQAFTPTHITDFMCSIVGLNTNSKVLDPTCGSGSFLVQAMSKMIKNAENNMQKINDIKQKQLFGIEKEELAFGLATTNMLIHKDGRSNIILGDCFELSDWIKKQNINVVLMNPPFNAKKMPKKCPQKQKSGMDATKGFYFVKHIADTVNNGLLATILPLSCAIGNDSVIKNIKSDILKNHHLKAVFSLPNDVFHPGAAVSTCIMLFQLNTPHMEADEGTFFGYYKNDGFIKKKNMGRVEKVDWQKTRAQWINTFRNREQIPGFSIIKRVDENDEWLPEAYMETDYSQISEENFVKTIREFLSYKVKKPISIKN